VQFDSRSRWCASLFDAYQHFIFLQNIFRKKKFLFPRKPALIPQQSRERSDDDADLQLSRIRSPSERHYDFGWFYIVMRQTWNVNGRERRRRRASNYEIDFFLFLSLARSFV
jgi:hypothetical protein